MDLNNRKMTNHPPSPVSRDTAAYANKKSIGPALETLQSHKIEYGVSKIVPEGHREENKSPAVLRGSATRGCISVPVCDQSTALISQCGYQSTRTGTKGPGRAPLRWCTGLHLIL